MIEHEKIRRLCNKVLNRIKKPFIIKKIRSLWLGSNYGGFFINTDVLSSDSVIYSFGVGEDISFDEEISNLTGAIVHGFDPTPKSIEWIKKNKFEKFKFHGYGIGIRDDFYNLYLPINPAHVSASVLKNNNVGKNFVNVKLKTLDTIIKNLKHSKIDVLKLDIEGLEYQVISYILQKNIEIGQILVEFYDRFFRNGSTKRKKVVRLLKQKGFILFAVSDSFQEFSFIKKNLYIKTRDN